MKLEDTGKTTWGRKVYKVSERFCYVWWPHPIIRVWIPRGFETDLASIPWPLHHILPADGPWKRAAVVHDYLCTVKARRALADALFLHIMWQDKVKIRWLLYYAVRAYWVLLGMWLRKPG